MDSQRPQFLLFTPWASISVERALSFEQELARELGPEHPLCGQRLEAIAVTCERDDVLFRSDDGAVAQVHLTYTANPPEVSPACPWHRVYSSLAEWMMDVMLADHVDHFGLWDDSR